MGLICWICGHSWETDNELSGSFGQFCSGSIVTSKCTRCGKTKKTIEVSMHIPSEEDANDTNKDDMKVTAELSVPADDVTVTTTDVPMVNTKKQRKTK